MKTKLLVCDFDGTVTKEDVLDKLCGLTNAAAQSRYINEKYVAGEIDGEDALKQRFRLISGVSCEAIRQQLSEVQLTSGAEALFSYARHNEIDILIVSGNLDFVIEYFYDKLGFTSYISSHIPIIDGKLGSVDSDFTQLVNKQRDVATYIKNRGLSPEEVIAVGDSSSDFPIFDLAGKAFGINWKGTHFGRIIEIVTLDQLIGYMV